ncbi:MAG: hypothetical protein U5Q44_03985 [Dehalococcoidia bacterium]|nr:hypothetical protein [Dehalococcoidia bacterium]
MDKGAGLLAHRLLDGRVGMAKHVDGETANEVQVFLAVGVPATGAFATLDDDGLAPIVLEEVALVVVDELLHGGSTGSGVERRWYAHAG